jgi:hypothetical protein
MRKHTKAGLIPRKTVAVAMAALAIPAATATVALAASVTGDGTLVGTAGQDFITAGNGQDTIWGLGGGDQIKAGNGMDTIDADGKCGSGVTLGMDYPNGLAQGQYCSHQLLSETATSSITAGDGQDVVYGGGGPNNIKLGNGSDTVYGGLTSDNINVGTGIDTIYAGTGPLTFKTTTGGGGGVIQAQNGQKNTITCATPNTYTVYASKASIVKGCQTVHYSTTLADLRGASLAKALKAKKAKKATHKRAAGKTAHKHTAKHTATRA